MYSLILRSFDLIFFRFPDRSFLKRVSFADALGVYLIVFAISHALSLLDPSTSTSVLGIGVSVLLDIAAAALVVFVSKMMVNRYARDKFSLQEAFSLQVLLVSGSTIVSSFLVLFVFLGESVLMLSYIAGFIFVLYMLLVSQNAISHIASISKSQAAYVIIAPIAVFMLAWILFLAFAGSAVMLQN